MIDVSEHSLTKKRNKSRKAPDKSGAFLYLVGTSGWPISNLLHEFRQSTSGTVQILRGHHGQPASARRGMQLSLATCWAANLFIELSGQGRDCKKRLDGQHGS